jgi:hypothetical protein
MPSNRGNVESGVYETFTRLGIKEPRTDVECLAVRLAQAIDSAKYAKDLPPLAHQLLMTMEKVAAQPEPEHSGIDEMTARY